MAERSFIKIEEDSLYLLYRRGNTKHIKALYEEGEIFMNTIDFIRSCDKNADRSDPYDGIANRTFLGEIKVKMCEVGKNPDLDGINFDAYDSVIIEDTNEKGNIFCLSGIFTEHLTGQREDYQFDTKSFGEKIIVIHNPKEFIDRIFVKLKEEGYDNIIFKRVSYYTHEYTGKIGLFRKHEKFSTQNEVRLYVPNKENKIIKFKIGPISDISHLENNTILKVTYTDGKEQNIRL